MKASRFRSGRFRLIAAICMLAVSQACAAAALVEIDPGRSLGALPRLYRPSAMMAFADRDAVEAFLSLPGKLGTVRLTLEHLIRDSRDLDDFLRRLDREAPGLRRLEERDARIVLVLARTPRWLARSQSEALAGRFGFTKREASPPRDYDAYADFVYQTVRLLNGKHAASPWYEFWNEPDSEAFWGGTREELLRTYESFARAARRADARARVGGLAVSGWYKTLGRDGEPLLSGLLRRASQSRDMPLDFISWHNFGGHPEQEWWGAEAIRKWLDRDGLDRTLPQVVTEWNRWTTFPEWNDKTRDGPIGAANIPATLQAMERSGIALQTFAALQDFNASPRDEAFVGDFGMVTRDPMLKKAAFHVMNLLGMLQPSRIGFTVSGAAGDVQGLNVLATGDRDRMAVLVGRFANDPAGSVIRSLQGDGFEAGERLGIDGGQFDAFMQRKTDLAGIPIAPRARAALERARSQYEFAQSAARDLVVRLAVLGNPVAYRYRLYLVDADHANPAGRYRLSRSAGKSHADAVAAARGEVLAEVASGTGRLPELLLQPHSVALLVLETR